ncbi:MAG: hypothetical protein ABSG26_10090 [Bryobacteraceae bacterium]|jgi:hypothetical protein
MSTEVQQILTAVRVLSSKERRELAMALEQETLVSPVQPNLDLILAVRGKYAHVPTSSDAFMARKREDLASEN